MSSSGERKPGNPKPSDIIEKLKNTGPLTRVCETCKLPPEQLKIVNSVKSAWRNGELDRTPKVAIFRTLVEEVGYPYTINTLFKHFSHE